MDQRLTKSNLAHRSQSESIFWTIFLMVFAAVMFASNSASAIPSSAQTMTIDGRLFTTAMVETPLLDPSVVFDIKIYDAGATCVLYEEKQTINTATTDGRFTLLVGSSPSDTKRVTGEPGNSMATIFQNFSSMPGSCGTYTPSTGDGRVLRIIVTPSTTSVQEQLSPDVVIDSVPNALVAESLQGLDRAHVLALDPSTSLTQANVASVFSNSNYTQLSTLLAGTNSNYVQANPSGVQIPSVAATPASPAVGQIWFNSSANAYQYWDGTAVEQLSFSGSGGTSGTSSQWTNVTGGINYSAGRVGIGSSSPVTALDVVGGVNTSLGYGIGGSTALWMPGFESVSVGTDAGNPNSQTAVGRNALVVATGYDNTAIGPYASQNITSGSRNSSIGRSSLYTNQTGNENVAAGFYSLFYIKGSQNTGLGSRAGTAITSGDNNLFLGFNAGSNMSSGSNNIIIGANVGAPAAAGDNQLNIGNIIYGDLSTKNVGIGTSTPAAALDINGLGTQSAVVVPRDTTANRPTSAVNGMIRYNTSLGTLETYSSGAWAGLATSAGGGGAISGSGTANYLAKYSATSTLANSIIADDGTHVGIGTAPTSSRLTVNGDTATSRFLPGDNEGATYPNYAFSVAGDGNQMGMYYIGTNTFGFSTNATERMRFDSSGHVGIGSQSPTQPLDVVGNIQTTGGFVLSGSSAQLTNWAYSIPVIQPTTANSQGLFAVIPSGTSTAASFTVMGSAFAGSAAHTDLTQVGDTGTLYNISPAGLLALGTQNQPRLTIAAGGFVGINTTNPNYQLQVEKSGDSGTPNSVPLALTNAYNGDGPSANINFLVPNSVNSADRNWGIGNNTVEHGNLDFYVSSSPATTPNQSTAQMSLTSDAKLGINTTRPAATLDVNGHVANSAPGTPTLSSCGSATIVGNDTRGLVTGLPPDGCVVTFSSAYGTAPYCVLTRYGGTGSTAFITITSLTTTSFSVGASSNYPGFIYMCMQ